MKDDRRELAGLLAVAVVFAVACVFLGRWQYHRFQSKYDADHVVGVNYTAAPASLESLLPAGRPELPHGDRWRPVRVTGQYDVTHQVLVRNRPYEGTFGYEVLVPLLPAAGGPALLVDRGWVANGQTGSAPDSVPAPATGPVDVTAHLVPGERAKSGTLPAGQFASIDLPRIAASTGLALLPAYGVLSAESPRPGSAPRLLPEPDDGGYWGVNLSYAVQWGLFALAGLAFPFVFVRRRRRLRAQDLAAAEATSGTGDRDAVPAGVVPAPRRRKTRIWDEEDE
ncbi:MAG: SURF1 family protein [Actinomycetales bacterium]